ncbi:MAG: 4'-phosphopantetheinyl transferase superfamily protein [Desulfobacteraceae bacterium]|nr:4'-phosphopantetheinyl transferase superfamily protein [Desulfobacteraceae bacterium]
MTGIALVLDREIGLDIEDFKREIDIDIADRYFSKPESQYLKNCPGNRQQEVFFDLWTLKESYIKAKGMGLSLGLDKFSFHFHNEKIGITFHESIKDVPSQWQFFKFSPQKNYTAAISVQPDPKAACKLNIFQCIPFTEIKRQDILLTY